MENWDWGVIFAVAVLALLAVWGFVEYRRSSDRPVYSKIYHESSNTNPGGGSFLHWLKRLFRPKKRHHHRHRSGPSRKSH